jgi:hypothetical protein
LHIQAEVRLDHRAWRELAHRKQLAQLFDDARSFGDVGRYSDATLFVAGGWKLHSGGHQTAETTNGRPHIGLVC